MNPRENMFNLLKYKFYLKMNKYAYNALSSLELMKFQK